MWTGSMKTSICSWGRFIRKCLSLKTGLSDVFVFINLIMSIQLERWEPEHIRAYWYKTNGSTQIEIYIFDPFWSFIASNLLPDWLAPNLLTFLGLVVPLIDFVLIGIYDQSLTGVLPAWIWFICLIAAFWYQTIDAIDGKQARRTDNCSPLGQLLDYNLD